MAHERGEIREAFKDALLNQTVAGDRVWKSRTVPLRVLPALGVYTPTEESTELGGAQLEKERVCTVVVEGFVQVAGAETSGEAAEDAADALTLEIETAIDRMVAKLATQSVMSKVAYVGAEYDFGNEGARPLAAVRLEYAVTYFTDLRIGAAEHRFNIAEITTQVTPAVEDAAVHMVTDINQEPEN